MRFEIKMKKKRCEFEINKIKINEIQNKENEIQNKNKRKTKRDNKETIKRFARTIGLTCGGVRRERKRFFSRRTHVMGLSYAQSQHRSGKTHNRKQKFQHDNNNLHFCNRGVQKESSLGSENGIFSKTALSDFTKKLLKVLKTMLLVPFFSIFEKKGSLGVKKNKWFFKKLCIRKEA